MLVTSRSGKRWVIPKGLIESNMSAAKSAEKEALEEAGVKGIVYPKSIGKYRYRKWGGICRMTILLMEVEDVLETWPECQFRKRRWFNFDKFVAFLDERVPRKIVKDLKRYMRK